MIGGDAGKRPSVVVDYEIKRVTRATCSDRAPRRAGPRAPRGLAGVRVGSGGGFGFDASRSASSARPIARKTSETATTEAIPKSVERDRFAGHRVPGEQEHRHGDDQDSDDACDQTAHAPAPYVTIPHV